jgi:hypothetical protein
MIYVDRRATIEAAVRDHGFPAVRQSQALFVAGCAVAIGGAVGLYRLLAPWLESVAAAHGDRPQLEMGLHAASLDPVHTSPSLLIRCVRERYTTARRQLLHPAARPHTIMALV